MPTSYQLKKPLRNSSQWDINLGAIKVRNFMDTTLNSSTFSIAEDMKKYNGNLFKLQKDVFQDKRLIMNFKWKKK